MASLATLALALLTLVAGGILWFGGPGGGDEALRPKREAVESGSTQGREVPGEEPLVSELRTDFGPTQPISVEQQAAWKDLGRSFAGTCTISGVVEVAGDEPFPDRWTLVIEPTKIGLQGELAARRIVEMDGAQRTFEEHDLPLGGYAVSVEAAGLTSRPQEVLLYKLEGQEHLPGKSHVHLTLRLERSGFIDGAVRDADGAVVEGLLVTLENLGTHLRSETRTSPSGVWRLEDVREGRYRITYGNPERPLVSAEEFTFTSSQLRRPVCTVPVTASIRFLVVDGMGQVLPGARVRGIGKGGGTVDVITGQGGEALARFLLPGTYSVRVDDPTGHFGKLSFDIEGNEVEKLVEIPCRPER
jgi:hypothetical protein